MPYFGLIFVTHNTVGDSIQVLGGPQTMTFGENQIGKMCLSGRGGVSSMTMLAWSHTFLGGCPLCPVGKKRIPLHWDSDGCLETDRSLSRC